MELSLTPRESSPRPPARRSSTARLDFVAEIEDALGVADQEAAGVGELAGAGAAGEEGLADLVLQLADGDAHGGLGAEELLGGAGEAALAGDGEEDVEFGEVHRALQP